MTGDVYHGVRPRVKAVSADETKGSSDELRPFPWRPSRRAHRAPRRPPPGARRCMLRLGDDTGQHEAAVLDGGRCPGEFPGHTA